MTQQMDGGRTGVRALPAVAGRELAELILEECVRSGAGPGDRLPTERQLALDLRVTRTAVRHALGLLEARGQVSREVGRGTFLQAPEQLVHLAEARTDGSAQRPDDVGPADVMAVRRLIEPQALALVVAWATARDFEEMERCLDGGDAAETSEEFEAWDFALHHAIVAAAHSPLLLRMYGAVESARRGQIWGNMKRRNDSRQRRSAYQQDHRALVDALRSRELERAVAAMEGHLSRVTDNLMGAIRASADDATA
jgi:DNA-binding FadR family transcriptional regulator